MALAIITGACLIAGPATVTSASGSGSTVTVSWTGYGTKSDGDGGRRLRSPRCDADQTPYLVFVLSDSKARSATLTVGDNPPLTMSKVRGRSDDGYLTATYSPGAPIDLAELIGDVSATYTISKDRSRDRSSRSSSESSRGRLTVTKGCTGDTKPSVLTVVFLGEVKYDLGIPAWTWGPLGAAFGPTDGSVCETAVPTNCVTFPNATTPGTTGTITMSGPGSLTIPIPIPATPDSFFCLFGLFESTATAPDVVANTAIPVAYRTYYGNDGEYDKPTTTTSYNNGNTVYLAHRIDCG